jgi:hypothetical protein
MPLHALLSVTFISQLKSVLKIEVDRIAPNLTEFPRTTTLHNVEIMVDTLHIVHITMDIARRGAPDRRKREDVPTLSLNCTKLGGGWSGAQSCARVWNSLAVRPIAERCIR